MKFVQSKRLSALLGLALDGRQLSGVVVRRSNGDVKVVRSFQVTLALDPLTNDPDLVAREIRNRLDEAGIRERACAVCIPLSWALAQDTDLPDLPEADLQSFIALEAERGFPYAPADMILSVSRYHLPPGGPHASLIAVPKGHVVRLEQVLRAAKLRPVSFSLGIAALPGSDGQAATGQVTLALGDHAVEVLAMAQGGVVTLRTLEGAVEVQGAERSVDTDLVARELRITLGQLTPELRAALGRIVVYGRSDLVNSLMKGIASVAQQQGLSVERGVLPPVEGLKGADASASLLAAALGLAARRLRGTAVDLEFLPPRQSAWSQLTSRFASRKVVPAGVAVGAALLLVIGCFGWQYWQLATLEAKWRSVRGQVTELEQLQQQTRKFRPWFDESLPELRIWRRLAEAFPETGSVTAKIVQIKDHTEITCSGQARDNEAWLKFLDQLREANQIAEVKVQYARGKAPVLFNLSFRWIEGTSYEN